MRWSIALLATVVTAPAGFAQGGISGRVVHRGVPVAQAAVYLTRVASESITYSASTASIDQRQLRFVPRVLVVTPGSTVEFVNSDSVLHNVFSPGSATPSFDLGTYPIGERRSQLFARAGVSVILCHVHPEMVAYVVVAPTLYHGVTDDRGTFELGNVPPGTYQVHVTHRRRDVAAATITVGPGAPRFHELALDAPRGASR